MPVFADGIRAEGTDQRLHPGVAEAFTRCSLEFASVLAAYDPPLHGNGGLIANGPAGVDVGIDHSGSKQAKETGASLFHPWFLNRACSVAECQIHDGLIGINVDI